MVKGSSLQLQASGGTRNENGYDVASIRRTAIKSSDPEIPDKSEMSNQPTQYQDTVVDENETRK